LDNINQEFDTSKKNLIPHQDDTSIKTEPM